MEQRFLGRSGVRVSELCLGTMTFGGETDEPTAHRMLDVFAERGGTFVDTADVYNDGVSEEFVGRWLAGRSREDVVIATKVFGRTGSGPNDRGSNRKHVMAGIDASLRRLGTDYIDLYQVHIFDQYTPPTETMSALDDVVRSGKVRYLGASNYAGWQLQKSLDLAVTRGWQPFVCLQPLYNLVDRDVEWELIPLCRAEGLGVIPWSPLRMGILTGKYRRDTPAPVSGTRVDRWHRNGSDAWTRYANESTWRVLDALETVADQTGRTVAQVALRWVMQRPGVTAPIIGARSYQQFEDNLGALGWTLSEKQMELLTAASDRQLPYPYDILAEERAQA